MKTALIIPTLNAGDLWKQVLTALNAQTLQPTRKILLDCQSEDRTVELAEQHGFEIHTVLRPDFNHGLTRQHGAELADECDILIYMTQDAVPATPRAFKRLLAEFQNPDVGAAYGRQLPREEDGIIETFTRHCNYPPKFRLKTSENIPEFGIKTTFCSNSFAAYRKVAFDSTGGFPTTEFGEDMLMAGKLLLEGYAVAYCAEAQVFHSHRTTIRESFRRGVQIGCFHKQSPWLQHEFGSASKTGNNYIREGLLFLAANQPLATIPFITQSTAKYVGFIVGKHCRS